MGMTYGSRMTLKSAELVRMADEVIMAWSKVAVPGAYLVILFLRWSSKMNADYAWILRSTFYLSVGAFL